jgi:hypothetical protein
MSDYNIQTVAGLHNRSTGALVGFLGADGKEYLLPAGQSTIYNPTSVAVTGGSVNGTSIGQAAPAAVKTTNLAATYSDSSGTPGSASNNNPRGRAAFAAAASSVVITSSLVTAASTILVSLGGNDATLTSIRVTPAAGSFTVTGNAAATATTPFDWVVVN